MRLEVRNIGIATGLSVAGIEGIDALGVRVSDSGRTDVGGGLDRPLRRRGVLCLLHHTPDRGPGSDADAPSLDNYMPHPL